MDKHFKNYHTIRSSKGGLIKGVPTFMGKKTNQELAGVYNPVQALLLGLLNREPSAQEEAILNGIICLNIYPDLRIWTMRTGAFCAINRAPFAASYGAALTALHSSIYGIQPVLDAAKLFSSFVQMQDTLEEKISRYRGDHKVIAGFGRPLIPGPDERVLRLKDILKKQQWIPGPHFNEFLNMEILLKKKMNLYSNYASVIAALLLDPPMSLNIKKINILAVGISHIPLLFSINDVDEHLDEYDPLLPLKVSDILYKGREKR